MPRISKVYTRQGDDGTTRLGSGRQVKKHSQRIEACGTVDELNAQIGAARACGLDPELDRVLGGVQNDLFHLGADLCIPEEDRPKAAGPRIEQRHIDALEAHLDRWTEQLGPLENFILPGGCPGASQIHVARTVCRRAERTLTALAECEPVGAWTVPYLNRLSDALFVMARRENSQRGATDVLWDSRT